MKSSVTAILSATAAALILSLGCGPAQRGPMLHPVSGKVDLNGEAISQGAIIFIPAAGTTGPSAGSSIENGAYSVPREKGLAAGNYRVEIRAPHPTGKKIAAQSPAPPGTMTDEIKETVPAKYNSASTLEAEIPAPSNQLDFTLTGP